MSNDVTIFQKEEFGEVRTLLRFNFGEPDELGDFQEREIQKADISILTKAFLDMTNAGYISPQDEEDLNHVRTAVGFAEKEVDDLSFPMPIDTSQPQPEQDQRNQENQDQEPPEVEQMKQEILAQIESSLRV